MAIPSQYVAVSRKRCKIGPKLLLMTNRKSHMRLRLVPKSTTLADLERPIRTPLQKRCVFGAHHKTVNEDRPILSAEKCRPMTVVSGCTCCLFTGNLRSHLVGMKFSTKDRNNDVSAENCAQLNKDGWWQSNLIGRLLRGETNKTSGVTGESWKGPNYSLKRVEMKIRRYRKTWSCSR